MVSYNFMKYQGHVTIYVPSLDRPEQQSQIKSVGRYYSKRKTHLFPSLAAQNRGTAIL